MKINSEDRIVLKRKFQQKLIEDVKHKLGITWTKFSKVLGVSRSVSS